MRSKRTRRIAFFVLSSGLMVYVGRAVFLYPFQVDACHVIALETAAQIDSRGTLSDHEIQSRIAGLIRASVIHGKVGADGVPTDLYGNAFIVRRDGSNVTVATERSIWQPIAAQYVETIRSADKTTPKNASFSPK